MKLDTIKTYVLHCKKLSQRKPHIEKQLSRFGISNVKWFTDFDADELSEETIKTFYTEDFWYDRFLPELYEGVGECRTLGKASISLCVKHIKTYEAIAEGGDEYVLMLEDDVVFHDNFYQIEEFMGDAPSDWDMIFMGSGCNLRPKNIVPGQVFYKKESPSTKCTDSFLINKDAAKKLSNSMIPFSLAIDFELNYHLHVMNFNVYWIDPPIVSQGSELGLFYSTGKSND